MTLETYLVLLNWTGRQPHHTRGGQKPAECALILELQKYSPKIRVNFVQNFRLRFGPDQLLTSLSPSPSKRTISAAGDVISATSTYRNA